MAPSRALYTSTSSPYASTRAVFEFSLSPMPQYHNSLSQTLQHHPCSSSYSGELMQCMYQTKKRNKQTMHLKFQEFYDVGIKSHCKCMKALMFRHNELTQLYSHDEAHPLSKTSLCHCFVIIAGISLYSSLSTPVFNFD